MTSNITSLSLASKSRQQEITGHLADWPMNHDDHWREQQACDRQNHTEPPETAEVSGAGELPRPRAS
jgi:hypothetical protein